MPGGQQYFDDDERTAMIVPPRDDVRVENMILASLQRIESNQHMFQGQLAELKTDVAVLKSESKTVAKLEAELSIMRGEVSTLRLSLQDVRTKLIIYVSIAVGVLSVAGSALLDWVRGK